MNEENEGHEIDEIAKEAYRITRELTECSYNEIVTRLSPIFKINQVSFAFKRKIYNSLSILSAAGLVECKASTVKLGSGSKLTKSEGGVENVCEAYNKVIKKENELRFKMFALMKYWALMKYRQNNKTCDETKIHIPFILIKSDNEPEIERTEDELSLTFSIRPSFYSPQEVLSKMNYPINLNEFIKEYPSFGQTFWDLFEQE
jgi:hypothetical protein